MAQENYIRGPDELGLGDAPLVGGTTASLGELFTALVPKGINVPDGFAVTSGAYRDAVEQGGCRDKLAGLMRGLDRASVGQIAARANAARQLVYRATSTEAIRTQLAAAYRKMQQRHGRGVAPATYSDVAQRLVALGIDSISVNPASLVQTFRIVAAAEAKPRSAKAALG